MLLGYPPDAVNTYAFVDDSIVPNVNIRFMDRMPDDGSISLIWIDMEIERGVQKVISVHKNPV